jgi:hypothetical protein
MAQEELVRRDRFSEDTLRVLDDLAKRVEEGTFKSDLFPEPQDSSKGATS